MPWWDAALTISRMLMDDDAYCELTSLSTKVWTLCMGLEEEEWWSRMCENKKQAGSGVEVGGSLLSRVWKARTSIHV